MTTYIFDTLAFPDVTGEPKPWLATSWTSSPDGMTWTFVLNDKATFHDGRPVSSADVVFTFEYNLTGPGAATGVAQGVTYIDTVTAPDPRTVVIQLTTVRPTFVNDIAGAFGFAVMPTHIWEGVTDPATFQGPTSLIGSGPSKLERFDLTANSFTFVANEEFYLGPARVRQLELVPVVDGLLALEGGQVDAASAGDGPIPRAQFDALGQEAQGPYRPGRVQPGPVLQPAKRLPVQPEDLPPGRRLRPRPQGHGAAPPRRPRRPRARRRPRPGQRVPRQEPTGLRPRQGQGDGALRPGQPS